MSTPTHLAALEDIQDSLKWLREVVTGLPVQALDWVPAAGANPITVLASHAIPSTLYWAEAGSGKSPSHRAYVENHRRAAFETNGLTSEDLLARIEQAEAAVEAALRDGREEHLVERFSLDDEPDEAAVSGATCLLHGASHLREHVGQAALTRDFWLALSAGSRR
ncbi:MAG TPA: DinB family protein [Tepidiformaceae bacterium]|nr:DinB family protein [Tepidiformaceae bacterium]